MLQAPSNPVLRITAFLLLAGALSRAQAPAPHAAADTGRQEALALEQQGKVAEAQAAWRAYSKAHPSSAEAFAHLGLLASRTGSYAEAIPLYRKALAISPNVPGLRLNLGLAYFKSGEMKAAISEFQVLLKAAPAGSPEAQRLVILLGMAHYGIAQYADAVPYLKQAAAQDQNNLPLLLTLAHSCLWSKQYPCVLDAYHQILTLNAESAEADMLAGEALDEMKDTLGAIQQFRAAEKVNPREPEVHFGLGYLLWTQKQYTEAIAEFQRELELNPTHAQALLYEGDSDLQLNNPEAARPLLQKALAADPSLWMANLDLGIIDSGAGRNDDALRELEAAAKQKPDDVNVHWRLGRLYRTLGRKDEAKAEMEKASKLTKAVDSALIEKMNANRRQDPPPAASPHP